MKKKHIVLICITSLLLLITVLIAIKIIADNQKFNISGDIRAVEVTSSLDNVIGGPIKTSETEHISVLLNCIKEVKQNNKNRIYGIDLAPTFYKITFYFDDGSSKTYEYTTYPATQYKYPFEPFYDLFGMGK